MLVQSEAELPALQYVEGGEVAVGEGHVDRLRSTLADLDAAVADCDSKRDLVALHRLRVEVSEKLDAVESNVEEEGTGLDEFTRALLAKRGSGSAVGGRAADC